MGAELHAREPRAGKELQYLRPWRKHPLRPRLGDGWSHGREIPEHVAADGTVSRRQHAGRCLLPEDRRSRRRSAEDGSSSRGTFPGSGGSGRCGLHPQQLRGRQSTRYSLQSGNDKRQNLHPESREGPCRRRRAACASRCAQGRHTQKTREIRPRHSRGHSRGGDRHVP